MAGMCKTCGGLIPAANEVLGYGGPMCPGNHVQVNDMKPSDSDSPLQPSKSPSPPRQSKLQELLQKYFDAYKPYDGEAEQTLEAINKWALDSFIELLNGAEIITIGDIKNRLVDIDQLRQAAERYFK